MAIPRKADEPQGEIIGQNGKQELLELGEKQLLFHEHVDGDNKPDERIGNARCNLHREIQKPRE